MSIAIQQLSLCVVTVTVIQMTSPQPTHDVIQQYSDVITCADEHVLSQLQLNKSELEKASFEMKIAATHIRETNSELAMAVSQLQMNSSELLTAVSQMHETNSQLVAAMRQLQTGMSQLQNSSIELLQQLQADVTQLKAANSQLHRELVELSRPTTVVRKRERGTLNSYKYYI